MLRRAYIPYSMGWSLDLCRPGDQRRKPEVEYFQVNNEMTDTCAERGSFSFPVFFGFIAFTVYIRCSPRKK